MATPGEGRLLLISAFARPQTSTTVRLEVADAAAGPLTTLTWTPIDRPFTTRSNARCEQSERASGSQLNEIVNSAPLTHVIHWPLHPGGGGPFDYQPVHCRELCRGNRVSVVWDQNAVDAGALEYARQVAELVERSLLPAVESAVGPCADVNGDGRLTIAVSPRLVQQNLTQAELFAFVRAADFRIDGAPPWSNQADVIYLAPHVRAERLPAILAHELTHVAQFSALRQQFGGEPWPLPDWLLEGHAHAVEFALTGGTDNLLERGRAFCDRPEASPLVIANATATGRWREPGCRGATAAFCLWLSQSHGERWWGRVGELVLDDDESWRREFGTPFRELYRQWTIDLAAHGLPWCDVVELATDQSQTLGQRPHTHKLPVDETLSLTLTGTATAYCVCSSSDSRRLRVRVKCPAVTSLQVTLVAH